MFVTLTNGRRGLALERLKRTTDATNRYLIALSEVNAQFLVLFLRKVWSNCVMQEKSLEIKVRTMYLRFCFALSVSILLFVMISDSIQ